MPASSTTCAGTQTGAQLSYDKEGRLSAWQNQPGNPTSQTSDLYDGEGQRVEQQVTSGGATTTIVYVGGLEEVSTTGSTTTTTTYYYANGQRLALAVNGVCSYLGSDGLGSAEVALDGSGNAQASVPGGRACRRAGAAENHLLAEVVSSLLLPGPFLKMEKV